VAEGSEQGRIGESKGARYGASHGAPSLHRGVRQRRGGAGGGG